MIHIAAFHAGRLAVHAGHAVAVAATPYVVAVAHAAAPHVLAAQHAVHVRVATAVANAAGGTPTAASAHPLAHRLADHAATHVARTLVQRSGRSTTARTTWAT